MDLPSNTVICGDDHYTIQRASHPVPRAGGGQSVNVDKLCPPAFPDDGGDGVTVAGALFDLDTEDLTDRQFLLAGKVAVQGYPQILKTRGEKQVAANLVKLGWGTVEPGASGETIFRLSQAGEDAFAWVRDLQALATATPTRAAAQGTGSVDLLHTPIIADRGA